MREFDGVLGRWNVNAIDLHPATRLVVRNERIEPLRVLPIKV